MSREPDALVGIHAALRDGCQVDSFTSGGGEHVVSISLDGRVVCQGWEVRVDDSLAVVSRRYLDRRDRGDGRPRNHHQPDSALEGWMNHCGTFVAWQEGGQVVVQLLRHYFQDEEPNPSQTYRYQGAKVGQAPDFWSAVEAAFNQPVMPVNDDLAEEVGRA